MATTYTDGQTTTAALIPALAAHLPGWTVDTDSDYDVPPLNGPDGLDIYVRSDDATHYAIHCNARGSGNLYNHLTYQERQGKYKLSIRVAKTKTPAQIAQDITRRLLPSVQPINARRIEAETAQADAAQRRAAIIGRLEQTIAHLGRISRNSARDAEQGEAWIACAIKGTGTYPRLTVKSNYQGTAVTVTLDDISPDTAAAVLALLAPTQGKRA